MTETKRKIHPKVKPGQRIFPNIPPLSGEEIARRKAEDEEFGRRCRMIFDRVKPELIKDHYDWTIHIEPDSGDYFIDSDPEVCYQKARQKHPTALLLQMRINETGTCGRI
jgi:hypothetical protein